MKLIKVPLDKIKRYFKNTKKHPPEQIKKIADSIETFGFRQPLVLDKDYNLVVGHGRYEALKLLNKKEADCEIMTGLNAAKIKSYRIMDNKSAESEWDQDMLKSELEDLNNLNFDMDLTGFVGDELDSILNIKDVEVSEPSNVDEVDKIGHLLLKCPSCKHEFRKGD